MLFISMISGIYLLTNKINGKIYVGKTINLDKRLREHSRAKSKGYIGNAIRKYGWSNFTVSILEFFPKLSNVELLTKEKEWISKLNSTDSNIGYNLFSRGDPTGYKHTAESKRNMSLAHIGHKHSDETKRKISESNIGRIPLPSTLDKLRKARKNRDFSFRKRKVAQINEDGTIAKVWDSATEAAKELSGNGRNGTAIAASCSNRYKGKIYGSKWKYVDNNSITGKIVKYEN